MSAPAVLAALPLLAGALCGAALAERASWFLVALIVCWCCAAVSLWRGWTRLSLAALCLAFFAAGAIVAGRDHHDVAHSSIGAWAERQTRERPVRVCGVLREDASRHASYVTAIVDATEVDGVAAAGGIQLTIAGALAPASAEQWRAGRTIAATAILREPLDYRNAGVPSDRERLRRQGLVLFGAVKSAALVEIVERGGAASELAAALRARVRAAVAQTVGRWSRQSAGIVTAILIGDRSGLDAEVERRLQEAGTYHVIAISGGNIALLTAMLIVCGRLARLPSRVTAAASIAVLAFYGYAAGLAPSVFRATVAGVVFLAARAADLRGGALNALALAAALACVLAPLTLLDPGFVLSFGATFAIVIAARRFMRPRAGDDRRHTRARKVVHAIALAARMLIVATVCAEIALAPIGAMFFGRVSFAGLILNFAAIPLMSIIQVAGLLAVGVASLSPSLASAPGWIAHVGTTALVGSAALVDLAPWLVMDVAPPALWIACLWYAGWAALAISNRARVRLAAAACILGTAIAVAADSPAARRTHVAPPPPGWTRVVFFDVGQGDATLVLPPASPPILVDAGGVPGSAFDLGRRVTLPAAWAFGVRRLGALVLTHGDPDHVGGAPAILRGLKPSEIWDGIPVPPHEPMRRLRDLASRARVPWLERRAGESWSDGRLRIQILNPPSPDWERIKVRNDDSIVLNVRIGDVGFVLPGDITRAVEPAVVAGIDRAPLTIVKAPHHGSAGSSSQEFVDALRPAVVVFSAGRRNPFGHPAPVVVERYRTAGAAVFSTADDGAVVVDTDGQTVVISTWTQRGLTLVAPARRATETRHGGGTKTPKITKTTKKN